MSARIEKWGNSLRLRLPKSVAEQVGLREGTAVEFATTGGVLTVRPLRRGKHTLSQLLATANRPSPHHRLDRDGPVGRELL